MMNGEFKDEYNVGINDSIRVNTCGRRFPYKVEEASFSYGITSEDGAPCLSWQTFRLDALSYATLVLMAKRGLQVQKHNLQTSIS